jgi:hypothetical protein
MNNTVTKIDDWLISPEKASQEIEVWEAGFDVGRQVVYSKFGVYKKVFLRPPNFIKRFYHSVYPLPIEEWQCTDQVELYSGFCIIDIALDVKFQATYQYALSNVEILSELNEHIKEAYYVLVTDIVYRELLDLSDGAWVQEGLEPIEKVVCTKINELLILQNIQSQVTCKLTPRFDKFPDVEFAQDSVYFCVLKKSFEFKDQKKKELFRQQQIEEKQSIEQKRLQLEQMNQIAELDRQRLALQSENNKLLLEDKILQQREQFEIKKAFHLDKIIHNNELKEMSLLADLKDKEKAQATVMESEEQEKTNSIVHNSRLKEREMAADISDFENEKISWREAKAKDHAEELKFKQQQKQVEFDTNINAKRRYEARRLELQEESFSVRKRSDVYLKREIELLVLEKQRLGLQLEIKKAKKKNETSSVNLGDEHDDVDLRTDRR